MSYEAKTDWKYDDTVSEGDLNRIEQGVKDAYDGLAGIGDVAQDLATHKAESASLTEVGHVQLSDSVTSTSKVLAATPSAVKQAMDRADAAFTSAGNGKNTVKNAITGVDPSVTIPTNPTYQQLADAILRISVLEILPGDTAIATDNSSWSVSGTVPTKRSEFKISSKGVFRVSFQLRGNSGGVAGTDIYGRVYKNGTPYGLLRTNKVFEFVTYTEDLSFDEGDTVQLYLWAPNTYVKDARYFIISIDTSSIIN